MSEETKEGVFSDLVDRVLKHGSDRTVTLSGPRMADFLKRYDEALPDDLPVIPQAADIEIKLSKRKDYSLAAEFNWAMQHSLNDRDLAEWIKSHQNLFARAWVLEAWKVEETGEVVRL